MEGARCRSYNDSLALLEKVIDDLDVAFRPEVAERHRVSASVTECADVGEAMCVTGVQE